MCSTFVVSLVVVVVVFLRAEGKGRKNNHQQQQFQASVSSRWASFFFAQKNILERKWGKNNCYVCVWGPLWLWRKGGFFVSTFYFSSSSLNCQVCGRWNSGHRKRGGIALPYTFNWKVGIASLSGSASCLMASLLCEEYCKDYYYYY